MRSVENRHSWDGLLIRRFRVRFPDRGPAAAKVKIHKIRYDPPGADYTSDNQLRAEYIVIRNDVLSSKLVVGRVIGTGWVVTDLVNLDLGRRWSAVRESNPEPTD